MKKSNLKRVFPFKKGLLYAIILLGSLTLGSYKSMACTASFTYSAGVNGHYTFTSTSSGFGPGLQYSWNPGDGSGWHYGGSPYNYTYTTNNTFTVQLAANDSTCFDTASMAITVSNVTTPCTLSANFTISYGPGGQVTFTSTSTGTNANTFYYWKPGDSNQRYQEPSTYTHTYPGNGNFYAWLVVEDTGSAYCIDSVEELVHITNAPCNITAGFTYALDTNGQVTFTNTSTGTHFGDIYNWNFGDLNSNSTWSYGPFVYTYASNGTYTVTLIADADSSVCADTISIPITISNACNMSASFTMQYDSNGQVMFTSTSTGVQPGAQYGWFFGDNTSLNGYDTATHLYPFIGYYTVTLNVVNPGGCTSTSTQTFYIQNRDSLQASFTYRPDSMNTGTYYFTSNSKGTNSNTYYKWTPGDGDPSDSGVGMTTYTHTYSINGPYSATLTIWYTLLPRVRSAYSASGRYHESSYTLVINVTGITGVQSINDNAQYTIYPNPNNGLFHIAVNGLTQGKNAEIRISDMMGRVVYQSNATVKDGSTLSDVSLPNVSAGVYLLQVISNGTTYTSKIAIQK
jgi:PKD repeat protein